MVPCEWTPARLCSMPQRANLRLHLPSLAVRSHLQAHLQGRRLDPILHVPAWVSCVTPQVTAGSELLRQQRCTSSQFHPLSGKDVETPSVCTAPSTQNTRRCSYSAWRVLIHHLVFLNTSTLGADRLHKKPSPSPPTRTPFPPEVWSRGRPHFLVHLRLPRQCHMVGGALARVPQLSPVSACAVFVAPVSRSSPRIPSQALGSFSSLMGSFALMPLGAPSSGERATPSSTPTESRLLQLLVDLIGSLSS